MTEQYIEELIAKYANGQASDEEIQKLHDWYRSFHVTEVPWSSSQSSEKEVSRRMLDRLKNEISVQKAPVVPFPWLKVAAVLFLLAGLATVLIYLYQAPTEYVTVTNPSGKIQQVRLPDSSIVWLNASTTLYYAKSFNEHRNIKLEGEAYFEVTHDPENPFQVDAGEIRTTVLGTQFNIKAYASGATTRISLISGKVKVADSSKDLAVLAPSTQLLYNRKDNVAETARVDTGGVQAWRKGKLQFQGESFAEIAGALENWYGVKIIFSNPAMRSCRYYMTFDNTLPLKKLLPTMAEIAETEYLFDESKGTITLSGKGCQ
jgi:ferric-dicitrate binding protein FerR (iron transport regulator)